MIVGVPREIKTAEHRVALVPAGVESLVGDGHTVVFEQGGGEGSGFSDEAYRGAGASVVPGPGEVWAKAELVVKVKEPVEPEWPCMRKGQVVFTYFHFAASEPLTRAGIRSGIVAIAYETVQLASGELPLLTPMSEVAGRMAVQEGAKYLEKVYGGSGVLLSGVPGVLPAEVLIIGGGTVGTHAAKMAAGLGAHVTLLDLSLDRLRYLADVLAPNVDLLYSNRHNLVEQLRKADVVVGAVLLPGAKAPKLVRRADLNARAHQCHVPLHQAAGPERLERRVQARPGIVPGPERRGGEGGVPGCGRGLRAAACGSADAGLGRDDRRTGDIVQLGELALEVRVALGLNAALVGAAAAWRAFAVSRVEPVHDVDALHHSTEGRKPHAVQPAVIAVADEELRGARARAGGREAHHPARIVLAYRVVRNPRVAPHGGHLRIAVDPELRHESRDHPEYPRAIVIAARDEVVEPVGPEGGPLAVDLDHEGTFAGLEAGAERGRRPHGHGGTRGVAERGGAGGRGFPMLGSPATRTEQGEGQQRHGSPAGASHRCSVARGVRKINAAADRRSAEPAVAPTGVDLHLKRRS